MYCHYFRPAEKQTSMDLLFGSMFHIPTATPTRNANPVVVNMELATQEIERYRKDHLGLNEDPLQWWKRNQASYSAISKLAKERLCIAGTSVPSERLFSAAGNLLCAKRSCLDSQNVDMLLFLNKNT